MNYLLDLYEPIISNNHEKILNIVVKNRKSELTLSNFIEFTNMFSLKLKTLIDGSFNNSGSGGSGIVKPNLSSITDIYLAAIMEKPVVKIGSVAITGSYGSTDFFKDLGLLNISNKEYIFKKFRFLYCDALELAPWLPYIELFKMNPYFRDIYDNVTYHYYRSNVEMYGLLGDENEIKYKKSYHINKPEKLITYYTRTELGVIDEILTDGIYINGKKILEIENCNIGMVLLKKEHIKEINNQLLLGYCDNSYWKQSLINSLTIALFYYGFSNNFKECLEMSEKAFKDKIAIKYINNLIQRVE